MTSISSSATASSSPSTGLPLPNEPFSSDNTRLLHTFISTSTSHSSFHTPPLPLKTRAQSADEFLAAYKTPISATTASLISTFTGFPLDSLKSRLQSTRESIGLWKLAKDVVHEEGVRGLWRGAPLPLASIAVVRTISFTIYTSTKDFISGKERIHYQGQVPAGGLSDSHSPISSDASTSRHAYIPYTSIGNVALVSSIAGAASGAIVTIGSCPFELVKVRRQLEFQIARDRIESLEALVAAAGTSVKGKEKAKQSLLEGYKPPGTWEAIKDITRERGARGLWTGLRLHAIRDTVATAAYFAEYDVIRYLLGRDPVTDKQGPLPSWAKSWLPVSLVPFLAGSVAGVTSWMAIYPVDALKTKHQQRVLSGYKPRSWSEQMSRLVRGTDPNNPKPLLVGLSRLYRGLGVSVIRSIFTHGLLWTMVDAMGKWIDEKPVERYFQ